MTQLNKKSQTTAVLQYLLSGHTLTCKEASDKFGCTRLPARINVYKKEGYKIADKWEEGVTRFGTPTRYKRYSIVK